jgi:hypothetical protein
MKGVSMFSRNRGFWGVFKGSHAKCDLRCQLRFFPRKAQPVDIDKERARVCVGPWGRPGWLAECTPMCCRSRCLKFVICMFNGSGLCHYKSNLPIPLSRGLACRPRPMLLLSIREAIGRAMVARLGAVTVVVAVDAPIAD